MNFENILIFLILFFVNSFLYFGNYKIANTFNLMDIPDKIRKLHDFNVPLTGGLFLFLNILIIFYINNYLNLLNSTFLNFNLLFFIFIIFIFGIVDDKFGINANFKLLLSVFLFFSSFLFLNEHFILKSITISTGQKFELGRFSFPFTVFCFVIFQNAFNMYDGINLQNILYFVFLIIIIYIFLDM